MAEPGWHYLLVSQRASAALQGCQMKTLCVQKVNVSDVQEEKRKKEA